MDLEDRQACWVLPGEDGGFGHLALQTLPISRAHGERFQLHLRGREETGYRAPLADTRPGESTPAIVP